MTVVLFIYKTYDKITILREKPKKTYKITMLFTNIHCSNSKSK